MLQPDPMLTKYLRFFGNTLHYLYRAAQSGGIFLGKTKMEKFSHSIDLWGFMEITRDTKKNKSMETF